MDLILRIVLASILGGLIGLERESTNRPAGFRTHILVTIGSALIMLVSIEMAKYGGDPARIAAQVISGIGFLGAGTILRTGNNIEGLTTAASLWVCAGIGLATGGGFYLGAIVTTATVWFFLKNARTFERVLLRSTFRVFEISGVTRPGLIGDIGTHLGKHHVTIKDIAIMNTEEHGEYSEELQITVKLPNNVNLDKLLYDLSSIEGVTRVIIDNKVLNTQ